ncbi:MAG: sugar ABC transporter permease [Bauldia sp.]|nr:sugar ABC transporter permease [Bauldia sp.]
MASAADLQLRERRREGAWLIAPMTLFLLILLGFPLVLDIIYSISKVGFETLRDPEIVGIGNYGGAISDPEFWAAAWFSFRFGIIVATAQVLIGLFLAIFLAPLLDTRPWLMAILMLPMMVAPALVGLMYRLILHEFVGILPYYLYLWLGDSPSFLGAQTAFNTLVTIEILQWTPFALLILYTAYAAIPNEIREAAAIDGVRGFATIRYIDLPMLMPAIGVTYFIRFIDSFRVFDNVYTLVGPGAGGSTTTMSIYIYRAFFRVGDIGLAVAASMLLLVASFAVLYLINRLTARRKPT